MDSSNDAARDQQNNDWGAKMPSVSRSGQPRIRSIKPEFWTDGKVLRLSDTSALFFIALWSAADDCGYFTLDSAELARRTGRWRPQDMMKMCSALERAGLVRCSRGDGVGMVVGWRHQRVVKSRGSKWESQQIQWDTPEQNNLFRPHTVSDRIGSYRIVSTPNGGKQPAQSSEPVAEPEPTTGEQVAHATPLTLPIGPAITKPSAVAPPAEKNPTPSNPPAKRRNRSPEETAKIAAFVGAYVRAYQTRFPNGRPEDLNDPKIRGVIATWSASHPDIERACRLIQVFFQMDRKWFREKGFDFLTFKSNLNVIGQALDAGADQNGESVDWAKLEREVQS